MLSAPTLETSPPPSKPTGRATSVRTVNLFPAPGEQLLIAGKKGSGKTTLALHLLRAAMTGRWPVAILDSKGEPKFSHLSPKHELDKIKRDDDVIVYRPDASELGNKEVLDEFLQRMYLRPRSGVVYIDELGSLGSSFPKVGLLSLLQRGREHMVGKKVVNTTLIGATQRPRSIPMQCITDSSQFAIFRLIHPEDRKVIAGNTHPTLFEIPAGKHEFWYYRDGDEQPILCHVPPLDFLATARK